MRYSIPVLLALFLLFACGGENIPQQRSTGTVKDSTPAVKIPQFDISGRYIVRYHDGILSDTAGAGNFYSIPDAMPDDTLYIQYTAQQPCEECRLETQIWLGSAYKDLVRDTGYGTGEWTAIPLAKLKYNEDDNALQTLSLYLSVRQYHPVETGNKRYLFDLQLGFAGETKKK